MSAAAKTAAQAPSLNVHQGVDYAVIMRPGETTDTAFVQVRYPTDEDMALITMFAAAPDLLAALQKLKTELGELGNYLHNLKGPLPSGEAKAAAAELARIFEPARAAIAKAEGRQ